MEVIEMDVLIVGAGVIGLAIAKELSKDQSVLVVEKNARFGEETSSRNSEVIHSGIYYPLDSLKTKFCLEGRALLYDYCLSRRVPFKKIGKLVVACHSDESAYLDKLEAHVRTLEVPHERLSNQQIASAHPNPVEVKEGIYFPETGIVDSHVLMERLMSDAEAQGATIVFRHKLVHSDEAEKEASIESDQGLLKVKFNTCVYAAGLNGCNLLSSKEIPTYKYGYCRGRYFYLNSRFQNYFNRLIYPVPDVEGLGVHVTLDLSGHIKFGPDTDWCTSSHYSDLGKEYDCDWESIKEKFTKCIQKYAPTIQSEWLSPGFVGIRPKLYREEQVVRDFVFLKKKNSIHCLGIESPGLTASLSIAKHVRELL